MAHHPRNRQCCFQIELKKNTTAAHFTTCDHIPHHSTSQSSAFCVCSASCVGISLLVFPDTNGLGGCFTPSTASPGGLALQVQPSTEIAQCAGQISLEIAQSFGDSPWHSTMRSWCCQRSTTAWWTTGIPSLTKHEKVDTLRINSFETWEGSMRP